MSSVMSCPCIIPKRDPESTTWAFRSYEAFSSTWKPRAAHLLLSPFHWYAIIMKNYLRHISPPQGHKLYTCHILFMCNRA